MRHSWNHLVLPLSMAASLVMVTGAGSAFAATNAAAHGSVTGKIESVNHAHARIKVDGRVFALSQGLIGLFDHLGAHARVSLQLNPHGKVIGIRRIFGKSDLKTGTITGLSSTTISLGTTSYDLVAGAPIHFDGYTLATTMVPLNTVATVELDSAGAVEAVWLQSDATLPQSHDVSGTVTAFNSTSITVDGYTLAVAPNVLVRADGQSVSESEVAINQHVRVSLNQEGQVDLIRLQGEGSVSGTVSGDTASTITIGSTTYDYAANATIRYHQYALTWDQIPVGSTVRLHLNAMGQVTAVDLQTDSNVPSGHKLSGTISAVSGNTIDLAGYTLTMAPTFDVSYDDVSALTQTITSGETASAWLNSSGQVARLVIGASAQN